MSEAFVSILVPAFNAAQYIRESLDSILAQTYPWTEVVVLDDASTDQTPAIVASYGSRVRYVRQPRNRGIYGNVNDGIALARGEYISVYHADDVYDQSIVEREVSFLERHPEAGAAFCLDVFIDPAGRQVGRLELPAELRGNGPLEYGAIFNALLRYKNSFLRCPSSMVRKAVYREIGPYHDTEFSNTADLDMWLRIARKYPVGILEQHLFRYRYGHGNSAQRYHHLRTDRERFFTIMDQYLEDGGRALAVPDALTAYEVHRAEDTLRRIVNHCARNEPSAGRTLLGQLAVPRLLDVPWPGRWRLLRLLLISHALVRAPSDRVALALLRRC